MIQPAKITGLLLCLFLMGCTPFSVSSSEQPVQKVERLHFDPNATATLTPFQPLPLTPTSDKTNTPSFTEEPAVEPQKTATPTPWQTGLEPPPEQVSILVLGSDRRPNAGFRTDIIQLVILETNTGNANIVSFPRDLYLYLPGVGPERMNTAFGFGGFDLMKSVFSYNFGIQPDHYVMTDFGGFTHIIDTLGGINVEVEQELTDKCSLPTAVNKYCTVSPGNVFMDGKTALWYVRSRYSTSDFDRGRRSQEVIVGISRRLLSLQAITKAPEFLNILQNSVETDMTPAEILALAPILPRLVEPGHVRRYTIGPSQGWPYVVPETGAWVFWPDLVAIQSILQQAMYFP
ncbi:MAG: LCP family protein [Anaerolineaceae bacterium]|nr:LCP family protein [Anaerolineaceae bacterium]